MRICRGWLSLPILAILVGGAGGCSTHPIADTLDYFKPGKLYTDQVNPYGGVCVPQGGGGPVGTTPSIPPPPVVPPAAPLPPRGGVVVPNLQPQPSTVFPVPPLGGPPQPNFPMGP